jgi:ribonuclease P protein component
MLEKKFRLRKSSEIQKTFARGRNFFNPFFNLKFVGTKTVPRLTVVVSTKVAKRAVVRNKIKRVVRENIRLNLSKLQSGDYAIVARPAAAKITKAEIKVNIIKLLTLARLLKTNG